MPTATLGSDRKSYTGSAEVTLAVTEPDTQIHYTMDGSEPTKDSPVYTKPVTITESTTVQARAYRTGIVGGQSPERFIDVSPVRRARFQQTPPMNAVHPCPAGNSTDWQRGLRYTVHQASHMGDGPTLACFHNDFPVTDTGLVDNGFSKSGRLRAVIYEGFFEAKDAGIYSFSVANPKISFTISIGSRGWAPDASGKWSVSLGKGLHSVRIVIATHYIASVPDASVTAPEGTTTALTPQAFWCRTRQE
jgi:hexosaminidase